MHLSGRAVPVIAMLLLLSGLGCAPGAQDLETERAAIAEAVDASIGWAATKDTTLLFGLFAHEPDMLILQPSSKATIEGFQALREFCDTVWMDPDFKATFHEIRDLRIHFSPSGDVAWMSAVLDDCGEYKGQSGCWRDARWTGVLRKQDGKWIFVQQHFSFAADKVLADAQARAQAEATP
jgi:ketosteroid isomerase-like protein